METPPEIQKNMTVYKIDTIDVDGKPEVQFKSLKRLVGERGFEPPTPWSRTRCSTRLSHSPTALRAVTRKTSPACFASLYFSLGTDIITSQPRRDSPPLAQSIFRATLMAQPASNAICSNTT